VFGLYFTRGSPRRIDDVTTTDDKVPKKWNRTQIYAAILLVAAWLETLRILSIFDRADKFGVILLLKLTVSK